VTPGGTLDSLGLWEATAAAPEHVDAAFEAARLAVAGASLPDAATLRSVVLVGEGTGALAATAVAAIARNRLAVPCVTDGHLPAFAGSDALVVALGGSPVTRAAAREATDRGAAVVSIGHDDEGASAAGGPTRVSLAGGAAERTGLAPMTVAGLGVLWGAGLLADPAESVAAASASLRRRRDALATPGGAAEVVARRLGRTIPLVYGSEGVGASAAHRWKTQVNLNAKAPAFWASLPAAVHEELAGWGQSGDVTRQVVTLVLLRQDDEDERTVADFEAVAAWVDEAVADIVEVRAEGEDELARFLDLVLVGDTVSLHLAAREGVDPGPTPTVDGVEISSA
jgi:glucose/mannose-6-phosphate isomerase